MNYFVYQLSLEGKVFYIGMTCNLKMRYKQHCGSRGHSTSVFISKYLIKGLYPDIKIIAHFNDRDKAISFENQSIENSFKQGVKLVNKLFNAPENTIKVERLSCNKEFILPNGFADHIDKYLYHYFNASDKGDGLSLHSFKQTIKQVDIHNDYNKAKEVATTLEVFKDAIVTVKSVDTFRKYLRDFSFGKRLITKTVDNQLRVTRLN